MPKLPDIEELEEVNENGIVLEDDSAPRRHQTRNE